MINLKLALQDRLQVIQLRLHKSYKYAEFPRFLPVGGWRDSKADQRERHEPKVVVTQALFRWCFDGFAFEGSPSQYESFQSLHYGGPHSEGKEAKGTFWGKWDQRKVRCFGDIPWGVSGSENSEGLWQLGVL